MLTLRSSLPELGKLERLLEELDPRTVRVLAHPRHRAESLPIYAITLGPDDKNLPVVVFLGGMHGVERIGTQVVLAHLASLSASLSWDVLLAETLRRVRIAFIPLVNPVGMALGRRANGRGVDLMRNAPVEAQDKRWWNLLAGQRISASLPWYRGQVHEPMEVESQAVCDFIEAETFESPFALTLDVHSGFHGADRVWFPYAKTSEPFPGMGSVLALERLLRKSYPGHRYVIEPQSQHYTTHGDLWDYLYDERLRQAPWGRYLPLTLELSASSWYLKNPRQLFTSGGTFNPLRRGVRRRVKRRHHPLFHFLVRAASSWEAWYPSAKKSARLTKKGLARWNRPSSLLVP